VVGVEEGEGEGEGGLRGGERGRTGGDVRCGSVFGLGRGNVPGRARPT
jgi:hypothetical protein